MRSQGGGSFSVVFWDDARLQEVRPWLEPYVERLVAIARAAQEHLDAHADLEESITGGVFNQTMEGHNALVDRFERAEKDLRAALAALSEETPR